MDACASNHFGLAPEESGLAESSSTNGGFKLGMLSRKRLDGHSGTAPSRARHAVVFTLPSEPCPHPLERRCLPGARRCPTDEGPRSTSRATRRSESQTDAQSCCQPAEGNFRSRQRATRNRRPPKLRTSAAAQSINPTFYAAFPLNDSDSTCPSENPRHASALKHACAPSSQPQGRWNGFALRAAQLAPQGATAPDPFSPVPELWATRSANP
jgi:hypothetical protein